MWLLANQQLELQDVIFAFYQEIEKPIKSQH